LTGQEEHSEVELETSSAKLRVSGTEKFVKEILSKPEDWIADALRLFTEMGLPPSKEEAPPSEDRPPSPPGDWKTKMATESEISVSSVGDIFRHENRWVSVHDWSLEGDGDKTLQEIALLFMYANYVMRGESDFSIRRVAGNMRDLGLNPSSDRIGGQLTSHPGISSPKRQWLHINTRGQRDAKQLLQERARALEGS
jgi:hypothetical protein